MTATPAAAPAIAQLEAEGVDTVIGTVVNPAGLTHAKTVPIGRTAAFAHPGLGASPSADEDLDLQGAGIADALWRSLSVPLLAPANRTRTGQRRL